MENKGNDKNEVYSRYALMLSEGDIDTQECYRHLLPEQKTQLIEFIYEVSSILYNTYFNADEST